MSEFIDIKLLEQYLDNGLLIRQTHPNYPISIWNYSSHHFCRKNMFVKPTIYHIIGYIISLGIIAYITNGMIIR